MGEKGAMVKSVQRGVAVTVALIAGLIPAATSTTASVGASSARTTGQAATRCRTVATIPVGPAGNVSAGIPGVSAVNPRTSKVYVSSINPSVIGSGQVEVINGKTNTVVATVPVGDGATGVAVNPRTNRIYVANTNQVTHRSKSTVSVISGRTN